MGMKRGLPAHCVSCRTAVSVELRKVVDSCPSTLGDMLRYHLGWQDEHGNSCPCEPGKSVRSTLCLLSCEAVGGEAAEVMPAAAAVELVHNFSLIHDDIEDDSYERHHRPTVWRVWGQSQAINAGDAMFALAYLALHGLEEKGISYQRISRATQVLSQACLELCEGQYLDLDYERRLDITVDEYLNMASKKTAGDIPQGRKPLPVFLTVRLIKEGLRIGEFATCPSGSRCVAVFVCQKAVATPAVMIANRPPTGPSQRTSWCELN